MHALALAHRVTDESMTLVQTDGDGDRTTQT